MDNSHKVKVHQAVGREILLLRAKTMTQVLRWFSLPVRGAPVKVNACLRSDREERIRDPIKDEEDWGLTSKLVVRLSF